MSTQPKLTKAYDGRGADMGRRAVLPDDPAQPIRLHLARMRMTADGCYDAGGAYWGCGTAISGGMWLAWDADGVLVPTRALDRAGAKANVVKLIPGATFYR